MAKKKKLDLPPPPPTRLVSVFDDPPRKNVLLLTCMDQRLLDDTVRFMNHLNLQNRYDQVALAGGSMGVNQLPTPSASWWSVFSIQLLEAINKLHRPIKDVFLLDHLDCGAYKYLHPNDTIKAAYNRATLPEMRKLHEDELRPLALKVKDFCNDQDTAAAAAHEVAKAVCDAESECWRLIENTMNEKAEAWAKIRISCFLMDLRGKVTQLGVPEGQRASFEHCPQADTPRVPMTGGEVSAPPPRTRRE